ncbi:MAG TPA: Clp protease N-terminal domain-containing protein [Acidimicrobiales bacterium]|nr:Clp protease N-terminal domain-containing protein [Acidimicrobiales bacterium]
MFERFTDRARHVIVLAQEEARALGSASIKPEHVGIALSQGDGVAALVLVELGVTPEGIRTLVAAAAPAELSPPHRAGQKLPFTPAAKKVLELSLREALQLGHGYIGTEHILLGLLRLDDSPAARIFGVEPSTVRDSLLTHLAGVPRDERASGELARSPAMHAALGRARGAATGEPMTTGHMVAAIVADDSSQGGRALAALGVTAPALAQQLRAVPIEGTTDEVAGPPLHLEVRFGRRAERIDDAELVNALRRLAPGELHAVLREALERRKGDQAS